MSRLSLEYHKRYWLMALNSLLTIYNNLVLFEAILKTHTDIWCPDVGAPHDTPPALPVLNPMRIL